MGRISRLSETVANQIAAGEVVERPASVVKELLENAVDAGARRIEIEIEDGGTQLIAITDDGVGMNREDAVACLERHATSKIREVTDLDTVQTLGFRGEAIPSIASVSRFSLVTRTGDDDEATRVLVEGGKLGDVSAFGAAVGTRIEVRDLFYNVPARRKFLKRPATEMSHINQAVIRLALAQPQIGVRVISGGRRTLDIPPATERDPRGRLARILSKGMAEHLYPVDGPAGPVTVRGWVGAPELNERTTKSIRTFVNGRFVRDRTIQHAVQDAYRTLMERGRYPVVVLFLDVDPALLDVNVHPQKTEVRFADTSAVHRSITHAIGETLAAQPWVKQLGYDVGSAPSRGPDRRYTLDRTSSPAGGLDEHRARMASAMAAAGRQVSGGSPWASRGAGDPPSEDRWSFVREGPASRSPSGLGADTRPEGHGAPTLVPEGGRFSGLEPVGQVLGTYLVCQGPARMVVIDQHAAHERVAFERMRTQFAGGRVESQALLVPRSVELDAVRAATASEESERLKAAGFEVEPFGGDTWLIKAAPAVLAAREVERVLMDVLDELQQLDATCSLQEAVEAMLSCAACHTVVRAGDQLGREEIRALLVQMDEIDFGAHCPHGRPVFVEWDERELARLFHRT